MRIEVTQKHTDDAVKWSKNRIGNLTENCIIARAVSEAMSNKRIGVSFSHVHDNSYLSRPEIGDLPHEARVITGTRISDWPAVKPFSFELELTNAQE